MRPVAGAPGSKHGVPPDRGGTTKHSRQCLRSRRGQSARHVQVVESVALRVEKLMMLTQGAVRLGREAVQTSEVPSGWFSVDSHKEQRSITTNF